MTIKFILLVFQNGILSEQLEVEQYFSDIPHLGQALAKFTAQESGVIGQPQGTRIYLNDDPGIKLPCVQGGYNPLTQVFIKDLFFI